MIFDLIVEYEYKVNLVSDDEFSWVIDNGALIHVTLKNRGRSRKPILWGRKYDWK
ncbi:hypothetical protein PIB30_103189 [Stylosanthes scabra]|uniref:Uncharacterized protein n=1 Tax=Stylosanthes scabra TaxID=79078 RepID=A0ABU6TXE0_9FABA|nr:hypothetical protein [Stylosanthes scabra]